MAPSYCTPPAQVAEGQKNRAPACIGASWSGMQQQHNLHMGTTMMHVSAHVQVACCCCIPLQLALMDAGARSPDLQQLALVVFFIPATSANVLPTPVVVTPASCAGSFFLRHTHTHTCTCTCITTARIGHVAPFQGVSQQKATRLVAPLAAVTPASSPQLHGPLSAVEVLIYGLARPMR